ncbi:hypothetical protein TSMEX_011363 [Taenia solium]
MAKRSNTEWLAAGNKYGIYTKRTPKSSTFSSSASASANLLTSEMSYRFAMNHTASTCLTIAMVITALWKNHTSSAIHVRNGTCYVGDQVFGSPCHMDGGSANITVNDVSKEEAVNVWSESGLFSTAIFVPKCAFQRPEEGEWKELENDGLQLCKVNRQKSRHATVSRKTYLFHNSQTAPRSLQLRPYFMSANYSNMKEMHLST